MALAGEGRGRTGTRADGLELIRRADREIEDLRVRHAGGRRAVMDVRRARSWWDGFAREVEERHEELAQLDRATGDGGFAATAVAGVRATGERLARQEPQSVGDVFAAAAAGFAGAGGTWAPLLAAFFGEFARECADLPVVGSDVLARAARAGTGAVQRLGGADLGEGTALDAMGPAAAALEEAVRSGAEVTAALGAAYHAAASGARSTTAAARTRRGATARRAVDPGALGVAWFYERGATAA